MPDRVWPDLPGDTELPQGRDSLGLESKQGQSQFIEASIEGARFIASGMVFRTQARFDEIEQGSGEGRK
jgi:hypothetical protein